MKIAGFWVVAPCSLVEVYQPIQGRNTFHLEDCCLLGLPDDGGSKDL
jgi:hypothetical protein